MLVNLVHFVYLANWILIILVQLANWILTIWVSWMFYYPKDRKLFHRIKIFIKILIILKNLFQSVRKNSEFFFRI